MKLTPKELADAWVAVVCAAAAFMPFIVGRVRSPRVRRLLLAQGALFLLALGGAASRSMFVRLTHKMVQAYHFDIQYEKMLGIASACLLVSGSYLLVRRAAGATRLLDRIWRGKWASVPPLLCSLGVLGFAISPVRAESVKLPSPTHVRSDYFHYRELGDSYLEDFGQLAGELSRRSSDRFRVLATLDLEVMSWWVTFRHGAVLAPDPFSTTLPDAEIEKRLASFGAILGLDAPGFVRFVTQDNDPQKNNALGHNNVVNAFFLSHNKYGGLARWYLTIPPAELERLDRVFQEHARVDRYRVDGLVLFSRGCLAELQPDPRHFSRVFENSTFRLYVANDLVTP